MSQWHHDWCTHAGLRGGMDSRPSLSARLSPADGGNGFSIGLRHEWAGRRLRGPPAAAVQLQQMPPPLPPPPLLLLPPPPPPPPMMLPQPAHSHLPASSSACSLALSDSTGSAPAHTANSIPSESTDAISTATPSLEPSRGAAAVAGMTHSIALSNGDRSNLHGSSGTLHETSGANPGIEPQSPGTGLRQRYMEVHGGASPEPPSPPVAEREGSFGSHAGSQLPEIPGAAISGGTTPRVLLGGSSPRAETHSLVLTGPPLAPVDALQHAPSVAWSNDSDRGGLTSIEVRASALLL